MIPPQLLLTVVQLQLLPWTINGVGGQPMSNKRLLHRDPVKGLAIIKSLQASAVLQDLQWQSQTAVFKEMTGRETDGIGSARGPYPCRIHLTDNNDDVDNNDGSEKDQNMKEVAELSSSV